MTIKSIIKRKFVRNVIVVASGTAGAQIITMLFSPIITRLYGPESFGVLGSFTAALAVLTPIAALTYPVAMVLPKSDDEAKGLAAISIKMAILIAFVTFIIFIIFGDGITEKLNLEVIRPFLYLIPLSMFLSAYQQVLFQWFIRKKMFQV
ncbi:MAG TPA: hypothetical protein DEV59_05615 [Proteus sp.]|nr:hypothetical protein [Proteus sp. (in: enterobacteria)]